VVDKDLYWFNRYRTVDGYNVYGGRSQLKFVDDVRNWDILQREMEVLDVMTAIATSGFGPSRWVKISSWTTATHRR